MRTQEEFKIMLDKRADVYLKMLIPLIRDQQNANEAYMDYNDTVDYLKDRLEGLRDNTGEN